MIVALILICGLAVPVPRCDPRSALMVTERTHFPHAWCLDDPNAGSTSAQIKQTGTYEKILCDWREPLPAEDEPIEITDAEIDAALNRGGPR